MKNIFKSIIFLSAAIAATGCIEEAVPQGSTQTEAQVAKSPVALEAMLKGIPASMTATNTAGYYTTYDVHTDFGIAAIGIMTDMMLEDIATQGDNPYYNRFYPQLLNQYQDARYIYCAYYWDCYYPWIKIANDVIKTIESNGINDANRSYLGQAYAYRASFYLDLARLFEPKANKYTDVSNILGLTVPIVTESLSESEATNNPRAKREDMYKFILSDLAKAEEYLAADEFNYTKPSVALAYGLEARAYLEMGYWDDGNSAEYFGKAVEAADKVINESGRSILTKAQWHDPKTGFNDGSANSSWIWGQTLSSENQDNIITFTAHMCPEATWGYTPLSAVGIDRSFYNKISDTDWRKNSFLSPEFIANPESAEFANVYSFAGSSDDRKNFIYGNEDLQIPPVMAYMSTKFRPAKGECSDYNIGNCTDHCSMRVEEMYFIKAEALAYSDLNAAKTTLESLIKTRDANYSARAVDARGFVMDEVLFQKRIEFWGEGILFYDYKRLDKGITRGYPGTNHASVYRLNCEGRSPQWNIVITRGEYQSNTAINDSNNNPDPSDKIDLWLE